MKNEIARVCVGAWLGAFLVIGTMGVMTGCASHPPASVNAGVEVPSGPPPLAYETVPSSPGASYYWIGGSWVWNEHWVWQPGHWQLPPHPGAMWIPDRYVVRNGHHIFIRGGWE